MAQLNHYDRIIAYESGQLTVAEQSAFEAELSRESVLQEEYQAYQATKEVGAYLGYIGAKSLVKQIGAEGNLSTNTQPVWLKKWAIAASIALVIGLASFYLYVRQGDTTQLLANKFYYALDFSQVRNNETATTVFQQAFDAYNANNYSDALAILKNQQAVNQIENELLKGYCLFKLGQSEEATKAFSLVVQQNDNRFKDNAQWQMTLCYLMQGEEAKAKTILTTIANSKVPFYSNRAKELLAKIEQ